MATRRRHVLPGSGSEWTRLQRNAIGRAFRVDARLQHLHVADFWPVGRPGFSFGKDTISDFEVASGGGDVLSLSLGSAFDSFVEVMTAASQVGANTVIVISLTDTITLTGVLKTSLMADDFLFVCCPVR